MQYLKNLICLAIITNLLLFIGCSNKPPSLLEATSVEKEFLEGFNKTAKFEYALHTTTRISGKTFWIYIATEKDLLQISSISGTGGVMPEKIIKFLDIKCHYKSSAFNLNYIFLKYTSEEKDIERDLFRKTLGGTTLYQDFTHTTIEILQKAYLAIGDIISKTEDMNFFAICLANIKKGIKITFVIHRLDMEQFLTNMLPSDEFYNRMILKTEGNKEILNDKYGLSIEYNDISLINFLEEQIVNNSRTKVSEMEKYNSVQLKSLDKLDELILKTTYDVITKYEFDDYMLVEVEDIITKNKLSLSKSRLLRKFSGPPPSYYSEEYNL